MIRDSKMFELENGLYKRKFWKKVSQRTLHLNISI